MLHQFALNENFLRTLFKELRYRVQELEDLDALSYVFYVLMPNNTRTTKGRRPLSICLKRSSPKCLELMLEMLMLDPTGKDFMRYVEPYLNKLVDMKSPVFQRFFDQSCKKLQFRVQAEMSQDQGFISRPTQYINQATFEANFYEEI